MRKFSLCTTLGVIMLVWCSVQIAHATPPPPEGRAIYLLPDPDAPYYNQSIDLGFSTSSPVYDDGRSSIFPRLSDYWCMRNFSYGETGKNYHSEVWYFNDWTQFNTGRDNLLRYAKIHGTVSPASLDITEELARTNDPYISGLQVKQIPAAQYTASDTSGYFIFLSTDFFPGENYFIAYYSVDGQSDLVADSPQIKTLIMSCLPGFVENRTFAFNPTSPISRPGPIVVATVIIILAWIGVVILIQRKGGA